MKHADDKTVARAAKRITETHRDLVKDLTGTNAESRTADKRLTEKDFSPDQRAAYDAIFAWVRNRDGDTLTFAGLGGTGKTSVVGVLANQLAADGILVAYCAFTGRAASVLGRKLRASGTDTTNRMHTWNPNVLNGRFAHLFANWSEYDEDELREHEGEDVTDGPPFCGTIHRLLYRPIINETTEELLGWRPRDEFDRTYDLVIADEASMIPGDMLADIRAHNVPLLAVGDHGQLPPVMGSGELMKHPDLKLEKIHRQAAGNPIITLAHAVRETGYLHAPRTVGAVQFVAKARIQDVLREAYAKATSPLDVAVLCWTNKTRIRLNSEARRARGISGPPQAGRNGADGDVMLCLKNYPPVFNGCRGLVTQNATKGQEPWLLDLSMQFPEEGIVAEPWTINVSQINRERPFASVDEFQKLGMEVFSFSQAGSLFDFGYAMTVHKMQGSGVPHVILYLDRPQDGSDDFRRWAYTAATRSSERLTICV